MSKTKILVCAHKACDVPSNDIYMPIHVGKALSDKELGFVGDDTGDNISSKNPHYCELTALYWAWKNLPKEIEYVGLCHYRRYFDFASRTSNAVVNLPQQQIGYLDLFNSSTIEKALEKFDIILAKPELYPYPVRVDYGYNHIIDDLAILNNVVKMLYPDYGLAFDKVMASNRLSHFNMIITDRDRFDHYCEWVFNILFEVEKYVKLSGYNVQQRVFGYMSERLLNVYCVHHELKTKYLPVDYVYEPGQNQWFVQTPYVKFRRNMANYFQGGLINRKQVHNLDLDFILELDQINIKHRSDK